MEDPGEREKFEGGETPGVFDAFCGRVSLYCWQFMVSYIISPISGVTPLSYLTKPNTYRRTKRYFSFRAFRLQRQFY